MTRNLALTALTCLVVAACGTPQERCISQNTREYRSVSNLLAEVEANLARGYAWEEREVWTNEWTECRDAVRGKDGKVDLVYRPCLRPVRDTERYRVPIDPRGRTAQARLPGDEGQGAGAERKRSRCAPARPRTRNRRQRRRR